MSHRSRGTVALLVAALWSCGPVEEAAPPGGAPEAAESEAQALEICVAEVELGDDGSGDADDGAAGGADPLLGVVEAALWGDDSLSQAFCKCIVKAFFKAGQKITKTSCDDICKVVPKPARAACERACEKLDEVTVDLIADALCADIEIAVGLCGAQSEAAVRKKRPPVVEQADRYRCAEECCSKMFPGGGEQHANCQRMCPSIGTDYRD